MEDQEMLNKVTNAKIMLVEGENREGENRDGIAVSICLVDGNGDVTLTKHIPNVNKTEADELINLVSKFLYKLSGSCATLRTEA